MTIPAVLSLSMIIVFSMALFSLPGANGSFSAKLYHRDAPGSPSYDPALSLTERVRRAVNRSLAYHDRPPSIAPNSPRAEVRFHMGEYMMEIALGTPPVDFFGILDTGSDLTWTQCLPCRQCFPQNNPIFDPRRSSTYRKIGCSPRSPLCPNDLEYECTGSFCTYNYGYIDGTESNGTLSTETLTVDMPADQAVTQASYVFGCGHSNIGAISPRSSGIIGLGLGPNSFITQLDAHIKGKFSYCLRSYLSESMKPNTINFGENAVVAGPGIVTTPLFLDYG